MEEIGSKEERRKRKKKIEVADLFRYYKKRPSTDTKEGSGQPLMKDGGSSPTPKEESLPVLKTESSPIPVTPVPIENIAVDESVAVVENEPKKKRKRKNREKKTEQRTLIKDHGNFLFSLAS